MQSGSSRSAERKAFANESVCGPDLALVDQALLRLVDELDRVLHRQHVAELVLVEVVHHRRQRRRLARAGRAGAEHQAARLERELGEHRRAVELLEGQDLRGNGPEHRAGAAVLVECIDAEPRQALDLEREIALQGLFVVLPLRVVHDVVHHVVHLLVLERVDIDAADVAVNADHRRQARREVQVGGLVLDRERQQLGNVHESSGSAPRARRQASRRRRPSDGSAMIADKLARVHERIASACASAGRPVQSVTLLVVSKTFGPDAVRARIRRAKARFGENYVQEGLEKILSLSALRERLEWHLIGPLQSNKTRVVAEQFDWVHTVDRLKLAERLSAQRPAALPPLDVCLQVNISGEVSKSGPGAARRDRDRAGGRGAAAAERCAA
jgi:hypothetical protein